MTASDGEDMYNESIGDGNGEMVNSLQRETVNEHGDVNPLKRKTENPAMESGEQV